MINNAVIIFVKIYQKTISRILPNSCRFYPTCSNYAVDAFKKYNFFKAFAKTTNRILRCNPLNPGGDDPA